MNNEETVLIDSQNSNMPVENREFVEEPKSNNNKKAAAVVAGVAAAGALGATAAYAANEMNAPEELEEEVPVEQVAEPEVHVAKEVQHVVHHVHQPKSEEPAFLTENEVEVVSIETQTDENGEVHHVAQGYVNGHAAIFVDDGEGKIEILAIDENDNGQLDNGEIHDMTTSGVTTGNLANHMIEEPQILPVADTAKGEVEVLGVEQGVDMDGETVDVAAVTVDDNPTIFIDSNQNGEVNYAMSDYNNNGQYDESDIHDVSDQHIHMPTPEEVGETQYIADASDYSGGDMPDYMPDANVDFA